MNLKNSLLHKKSQTSYLNYMLDAKLLKIRQKTTNKLKESDSRLYDENIQIKTDYSDSHNCQNCNQLQQINNELKDQILECQKQIDILKIERDVIQKKEEKTIKLLIQEIEKAKLEQKRCSSEMQQSLLQFTNDNSLKLSSNISFIDKANEISTLTNKIKQYQEINSKYADLLHQSYDFSININIKFATMSNSINMLINLIQKYTRIITHIQMQSSPQLDLLLPQTHEECSKQEHQPQLIFSDLQDMTNKIQSIQLESITEVQSKIETLIQLVADYLAQAQRIAIYDMSRTIV